MPILSFLFSPFGRWILIAIAASVLWGHGYTTGVSRESDRRDAAQLKVEREMWSGFVRRLELGRDLAGKLINAERARDDYHHQLQRSTRDAKNRDLAVANCPRPSDASRLTPDVAASGDDRPACFVTWRFVGLWDAGWTGVEGQPLFGDPGGTAGGSIDASPFEPRGLLENHQENARLCSADRARLARLTELLDKLEKDWDAQHRAGP